MCSHWKLRLEDVGRNRGDTGWYLYWFFFYPVPGLEKPTISPKIRYNKADILDIIDWRGMPENEMLSMCSLKLKPWDKEKSVLIREMIGSYCISIFKCRERKFVAGRPVHGFPWLPRFALKRNSKLTFDVLIHKAGWKPRYLRLTQNPRNAKILKVHDSPCAPWYTIALYCNPLCTLPAACKPKSDAKCDIEIVQTQYDRGRPTTWPSI